MLSRKMRAGLMSAVIALGVAVAGQAMAGFSKKEAADLDAAAKATLAKFKETKGSDAALASAKGVLVCPKITKGGFIVGVESGDCVLTSGAPAPIYYGSSALKGGLLVGIESYSMILLLNTDQALANFTSGTREWEIGMDASVAVAKLDAGGALDTTNLKKDIVCFIFGGEGLMADASFSGSRFKKLDVE
jgi:lipid-binding SYLF domain-containing protein